MRIGIIGAGTHLVQIRALLEGVATCVVISEECEGTEFDLILTDERPEVTAHRQALEHLFEARPYESSPLLRDTPQSRHYTDREPGTRVGKGERKRNKATRWA